MKIRKRKIKERKEKKVRERKWKELDGLVTKRVLLIKLSYKILDGVCLIDSDKFVK